MDLQLEPPVWAGSPSTAYFFRCHLRWIRARALSVASLAVNGWVRDCTARRRRLTSSAP